IRPARRSAFAALAFFGWHRSRARLVGDHYIGGLSWIDSLLNASMILGGMGPVDLLHSDAAKLFASGYALFSGLAFVGIAGLMIGPFVHRLLHRFHIEGN